MKPIFKYPLLSFAAFLSACGNASSPLPETLDIPEDVHPIFKDYFTICPVAMNDMTRAIEKAKATRARHASTMKALAAERMHDYIRANDSVEETNGTVTVHGHGGAVIDESLVMMEEGDNSEFDVDNDDGREDNGPISL